MKKKNEKSILKSIKLWIPPQLLHVFVRRSLARFFSLSLALMFCSLWLFHFPTAVVLCILLLLLMPLTMKNDAVVWSIRVMKKMRKREQAEDVWWKVLGRGGTGGWWEDDDELDSRMNMSELYWKIQRLSFSVVFWMLKTVVKIYDMISFSALLLSKSLEWEKKRSESKKLYNSSGSGETVFSHSQWLPYMTHSIASHVTKISLLLMPMLNWIYSRSLYTVVWFSL